MQKEFKKWLEDNHIQISNLWNDFPETCQYAMECKYFREVHCIHVEVNSDMGRFMGSLEFSIGYEHKTEIVCEEVLSYETAMKKTLKVANQKLK